MLQHVSVLRFFLLSKNSIVWICRILFNQLMNILIFFQFLVITTLLKSINPKCVGLFLDSQLYFIDLYAYPYVSITKS